MLTLSLGVKLRLTPSLVMVTVRMQPPEEPSRASAWPTALCTKSSHCSAAMPGRQYLSQNPVMYPEPDPPAARAEYVTSDASRAEHRFRLVPAWEAWRHGIKEPFPALCLTRWW